MSEEHKKDVDGDAAFAQQAVDAIKPAMRNVLSKIRERRQRLVAPGMIATHPPTLEEIAEIAVSAAVLAVGNYRIQQDTQRKFEDYRKKRSEKAEEE